MNSKIRNRIVAIATAILAVGSLVLIPNANDIQLSGNYDGTLRYTQSGTAIDPIVIFGNGATVKCLQIAGQYITVQNVTVTGCSSHGVLITGKYVVFENSRVFGTVTENGTSKCSGSGGRGSAVKVQLGGENVLIRNNTVYNNCGEGIAATRGIGVRIEDNIVYDNFSVNVYIDNSPSSSATGNTIYNTNDSRYFRNGAGAVCVLLGTENYAGWGNQLKNVLVEGNTIRDCTKGIRFYGEVGGIVPDANVVIRNNTFMNVPSPQVNVPGAIVSTTTAAPSTFTATASTPTRTPTRTPTTTKTATFTPLPVTVTSTPASPPTACIPIYAGLEKTYVGQYCR